jgi:ribonuclease R
MPEIYKKKILRLLTHRDYTPLNVSTLARELGVPKEDTEDFRVAFEELRGAGRVIIGPRNVITLPKMSDRIVGKFRLNAKGFGFVKPLEANLHGDLFIPPGATGEAMTGDTVMARTSARGKREGETRYVGEIIEIIERGHDKLVGTLRQTAHGWLVTPDGGEILEPVAVDDVTAKNASSGDKVVVEIIDYPSEGHIGRGVILEALGRAGNYDTEIRAVTQQFSLPQEFSEDCYQQAREAAVSFNPDKAHRRADLSDEVIVTIDPPDAKDFDDAISLKRDHDGNWVLGVHIADVSTFVTLDSPLDREAKLRGNSVYLPGKTIPMLPEVLSNGICSLQPGQKRFTKSVYITYDPKGNVRGRSYDNSTIVSKARLTYEQADGILKGKTKGVAPEVVKLLTDMDMLARAIEERRMKEGMIHLDLPETEIIMDKAGRVVDAKPSDDCYPHTIIEMFMVEANEAVAVLLDRFNVPFLRRIHPDPDSLTMKNLSNFVRICGFKIPKALDRHAMQTLLAAVKDTPYSFAINMTVLRSMQKAEYSPLNIGHFALASRHYTHFTSPIRRYADLMIHRLIECYLQENLNKVGLDEVIPEFELVEIGKHITFTEERADDAEEELKAVLILNMLSSRVGEELECVVTGLTNFGIFAQSVRFGIEGLISHADLGQDEWKFDSKNQSVVGTMSGKSIHLGQPLLAKIVSVNVPARQLNLAPSEPLVDTSTRNRTQGRKKGKSWRKSAR